MQNQCLFALTALLVLLPHNTVLLLYHIRSLRVCESVVEYCREFCVNCGYLSSTLLRANVRTSVGRELRRERQRKRRVDSSAILLAQGCASPSVVSDTLTATNSISPLSQEKIHVRSIALSSYSYQNTCLAALSIGCKVKLVAWSKRSPKATS